LIVIFVDDIENFIEFLQLRIIDEIFYEIKELKHLSEEKNENQYEIILHFLAKLDTNTVLYETKLRISKSSQNSIDKTALDLLQKIFQQVDISLKLVKGKIREIFLSYSS